MGKVEGEMKDTEKNSYMKYNNMLVGKEQDVGKITLILIIEKEEVGMNMQIRYHTKTKLVRGSVYSENKSGFTCNNCTV